jgi:hypothetical protein
MMPAATMTGLDLHDQVGDREDAESGESGPVSGEIEQLALGGRERRGRGEHCGKHKEEGCAGARRCDEAVLLKHGVDSRGDGRLAGHALLLSTCPSIEQVHAIAEKQGQNNE